jgi:predicted PurR-regulated permease PerM
MHSAPQPSVRTVARVVTVVVISVLLLWLIYQLRQPIGWLIAAAFIAVAVAPPVNRLSKHMPRALAVTAVYLGVIVALPVGIGALVIPPMVTQGADLARDLPGYARDLTDFVEKSERLDRLDQKYDLTGELESAAAEVPKRIGDAAGLLADFGGWLVSSIFAVVNVLILSIFMLAGGRGWIDGFLGLRPEEERERLRRVLQKTAQAISGYVQGAIAIGFIAGITTFIVLSILGVPFAAPLAVIAGLFSLIPLIGATIAAIIIGAVTLTTHFPTVTIIWAIWAIVYQQLENNIVQPQIQKRTVQIQPIVVLVAVLFGSTLLGVLGALVAIPLAASIQIVVREWWDWRKEQRVNALIDPEGDGDEPPSSEPELQPA